MNRRNTIKTLLAGSLYSSLSCRYAFADALAEKQTGDTYLMAYFMESDQKLYYAYSTDARNWTAMNNRKPVWDSHVNLRDPFISYANGKYHMVHTKGWDHPVIHHYESTDLINWKGGEIRVVDDNKKRAWAPEWFYEEREGLFYLFWASEHNGHNCIYYITTKNWDDIAPERAAVYYDIGIDVIDIIVNKANNLYYIFHKCGSLADNMGITYMTSPTLNPALADFGFGKNGAGTFVDVNTVKPIEGPETIKLNRQNKWYIYADSFFNDFVAWETTDFKHYNRIPISVPRGAKHCSMLSINEAQLTLLLQKYPV